MSHDCQKQDKGMRSELIFEETIPVSHHHIIGVIRDFKRTRRDDFKYLDMGEKLDIESSN